MRSAIYDGVLTHRRHRPGHGFAMKVAMPLLDADEVDDVVAQHPLWSRERANAVSHRRGDFLGDPDVPLDTSVRDIVEAQTGVRPAGPVLTLGHVRTWGWLFNPLCVHYCLDTHDEVVNTVLAVTNTPWKERHAYVLDGPGTHRADKAMHVSPFFGMDQRYHITYSRPGERLGVGIDVIEDDSTVFAARLQLRRHAIDRAALGRMLWRHPMLTMRVSAGIHTNALRLWRKGARYHPRPTNDRPEVTRARPIDRPAGIEAVA